MAFWPDKSSHFYRELRDHSSHPPFPSGSPSYLVMSPTTRTDTPEFHSAAATITAPGPERWHAIFACSTADGTTNCPLPPPPDETVTNATASLPTTAPASSARSAVGSRHGTLPSPTAA